MASNLQLLRVVAFDDGGQPVLVPLTKWKLSYSERRASLEIKCAGYSQTYDLRTELLSVAPVESRQKVSLGKTLGRVALTGLVHGRHGAAADLRWGGLDRDEVMTFMLFFRDTTTVQIELESDEIEALVEMVPDAVTSDEAYEAARTTVRKVTAMVADGPRVLDELDAKTAKLGDELTALRPKIEGGESFNDRQAARERCTAVERELGDIQSTRAAVLYTLAFEGKDVGAALSRPIQPARSVIAMAPASEATPLSSAGTTPVAPVDFSTTASAKTNTAPAPAYKPSRAKSGPGRLVKTLVFLLGAFVGCVIAMMSMVFFGVPAVFLSPVVVIVCGWLAVKMLNNLMSR